MTGTDLYLEVKSKGQNPDDTLVVLREPGETYFIGFPFLKGNLSFEELLKVFQKEHYNIPIDTKDRLKAMEIGEYVCFDPAQKMLRCLKIQYLYSYPSSEGGSVDGSFNT